MSVLDRDMGPLVEWSTIGRDRFERIVQALVPYQHPDGAEVQPIDGRGGDGGVDVLVVEPSGRRVVYQLKYLPEGFDGKHQGGRQQIRASLKSVLDDPPDEWVLVVPCVPTRSGWDFIGKLNKGHDFKVTFVGEDRLDGDRWVGGHLGVVRALVTRDPILEAASILNSEQVDMAVLADPSRHLAERVHALGQEVDKVDPHYTFDFTRRGDLTIHVLRPRHPGVDPIRVELGLAPGDDPRVQRFLDAARYGTTEPVALSGRHVERLDFEGTVLLPSGVEGLAELVLQPEPDQPREIPLILELRDGQGRRISTDRGAVANAGSGSEGWTLKQVLHQLVTITWVFKAHGLAPGEAGDGAIRVEVDPCVGADISALRRAALLLQHLTEATRFRLLTDSSPLVEGVVPDGVHDLDPTLLAIYRELAEDLGVIEDELHMQFGIPETITTLDRIRARILRRMLDGRQVYLPTAATPQLTLEPALLHQGRDPDLLAGEHGVCLVSEPVTVWTLAGQELELPTSAAYFFRDTYLEEPERVRAELEAGENARCRLLSVGGEPPVVYLPGRLGEGQQFAPQPWGLIGVDEPA